MLLKRLLSISLVLFIAISSIHAQDCSVPFVPSQFKARLAWQSAQDGPASLALCHQTSAPTMAIALTPLLYWMRGLTLCVINGKMAAQGVRLLRVYSRWGERRFERRGFPLNDPTSGWDGSFRGKELNPGVFARYADVERHDGRVINFKGDVTVVR